MAAKESPHWPVLTRYDQEHLRRIALPLGGIGTGTVSLGGRGDLRDWEIMNRPAKGFAPANSFFALYAKAPGRPPVTRALEGVLEPPYEGGWGCTAPNHGLPRFRKCSFSAAYPLGQVLLSDPDVPLDARVEAFNPLVPADAEASGIPVAILRFVLINPSRKAIAASVCGSLQNFIGSDATSGAPKENVNRFRSASRLARANGIFMMSAGVDPKAEQFGTMALATTATDGITYRTNWADSAWATPLLEFWDDFSEDGRLERRRKGSGAAPHGSLAVSVEVPPRGSRTVTFLLAWHFPNRRAWPQGPSWSPGQDHSKADRVGNYYTTRYRDAWDVALRTAASLRKLEARTLEFVRAFCDSDLPDEVKEAALYNLSTLRSQTCFRTEDGRFFGWEGCRDDSGCCHGSCTHVWNYEQATAFLFGTLARSMREVEFLHATNNQGHMSFRANLPLQRAQQYGVAAADGQMGCLMKLYRDWHLSGDDGMLRQLWPKARKALEFCWVRGGWDADQDGVMEGCQHNTMDVEYLGPNPQMGVWYLGALRAAEEMARYVGEDDFATQCRDLFQQGSAWLDANLFNGEYYEHEIRPARPKDIAKGLSHQRLCGRRPVRPDFQLGAGCLVDQLVGQCMAHVCGLGYLLKRRNVRTTLRSIMEHNFKKDLYGHFNHMRSFALNDEAALLMSTYPRGRRPERPFPYFTEVMTGFEYTAAVHMLYEGQIANGLKCIRAVRARYDGRKRSPFNEAECGHHYARAMASWAAVLALTGFHYSGVDCSIEFAATRAASTVFWSNGYAWGTCRQKPAKGGVEVELKVLYGSLRLKRLTIAGVGSLKLARPRTVRRGRAARFLVPAD
ncbi:MAG: GH116 family glycosyl-hydrolase [Planctomycetota bacterium]|jgi:uncharacterized protein (DUF608 family)